MSLGRGRSGSYLGWLELVRTEWSSVVTQFWEHKVVGFFNYHLSQRTQGSDEVQHCYTQALVSSRIYFVYIQFF